ncbi:NAD(P)-dependent oxidoreductase OS=Streptomyces alboniger OX=132473 GN=CP975_07995 PE=4 SV=1 [Streptomyces alboniger]
MPAPRTVLLTGAAGGLGTLMRNLLPAFDYELRLLDVRPIEGDPDAVTADFADKDAMREAVRGVDAIIHLAGISLEAPFEKILSANIEGTYNRRRGRPRGGREAHRLRLLQPRGRFHPAPPRATTPSSRSTPRAARTPSTACPSRSARTSPSCYWDKHGIETVSVRIGACYPEGRPAVRMLSVWMSPADGACLFHAALTAENVGHTVVYGSSANTRLWWDLSTARALGYAPQDDSEPYAEKLIAEQGELDPENTGHAYLGGHFVSDPPIWPY